MTKLEQAARQALYELENEIKQNLSSYAYHEVMSNPDHPINVNLIALREALAERSNHESELMMNDGNYRRKILAEQAEQEPVAWGRIFDGDIIDCICPEEHGLNEGVYTTPLYAAPVRTKDLTDDEIRELWSDAELDITWFARAVIAKFEEKNNV